MPGAPHFCRSHKKTSVKIEVKLKHDEMKRHTWNDNFECKVCGLKKATYKEPNPDGTTYWKVYYHREGVIEENNGCIEDQLKLW